MSRVGKTVTKVKAIIPCPRQITSRLPRVDVGF